MYVIHFPEIPNMGDLLNKDMLEELFGISVERAASLYSSNVSAIGSGLTDIQERSSLKGRIKQLLHKKETAKTHYIWGTGFINYPNGKDNPFIYEHVVVNALRGNLSKIRVEKIIGETINVPLGDGGLLAERWVGSISKKHKIGIIPHFKEQDHPAIAEMMDYYQDAVLINLRDNPKSVVKNIAECETIISSSLHGLIVADSYHIPNKHMILYPFGEKMSGDGFKFSDYYSAFGLKDESCNICEQGIPTINQIIDQYKIDSNQVEYKKNQLIETFPRL